MRVDAPANRYRVLAFGDLKGVKLVEVDCNPILHPPKRGETPVVTVVSKVGDFVLVCKLDLGQTASVSVHPVNLRSRW